MRRRAVDARITIAGTLYATQEWNVQETAQLLDMSNTEGIPTSIAGPNFVLPNGKTTGPGVGATWLGSSAKLADVPVARVTIRNMTFDDAANPFLTPISLSIGEFYSVKIEPSGTGTNGWNFPAVCVGQIDHGGRVPGAQPVTIHGESDGGYHEPWTTNATTYGPGIT
jgi:hypothetical protein